MAVPCEGGLGLYSIHDTPANIAQASITKLDVCTIAEMFLEKYKQIFWKKSDWKQSLITKETNLIYKSAKISLIDKV